MSRTFISTPGEMATLLGIVAACLLQGAGATADGCSFMNGVTSDLSEELGLKDMALLQVSSRAVGASGQSEVDEAVAASPQSGGNATLQESRRLHSAVDVFRAKVEYELTHVVDNRVKSKATLVTIELLGLGIFGLDHIYMGQYYVGLLKGLTFGGFFMWALLDYILVVMNCLARADTIDVLGLRGTFFHSELALVSGLVPIILCLKLFVGVKFVQWLARGDASKPATDAAAATYSLPHDRKNADLRALSKHLPMGQFLRSLSAGPAGPAPGRGFVRRGKL
ncbi:unnamed protein product [Polarella glacialis]|uniref:TM2 domain-containing protein n=1 Tax=Polarella glacialis TaxID=89957 RepID=A0A813DP51_POLGL|nr:unnamed protein product [Polarella glacialis]